jgi:hypothetical protein
MNTSLVDGAFRGEHALEGLVVAGVLEERPAAMGPDHNVVNDAAASGA